MLDSRSALHNNIGVDMDTLPRDVLLQVFSYLPPADLVDNVAAVSQEWRALASDTDAWRTRRVSLSIRPHRALSPSERRMLRRTPALRALALSIRRTRDLPAPLSELLPRCRHLRELQLTIPRLSGELLADVARHWPRLQELRVDATQIDEVAFEEISRLEHLRGLHVSALQGCKWAGLKQLARCSNLKTLYLNVRCDGAQDHTELLRGLKNLAQLHLGSLMPASDELFTSIGNCSRLQRLHIEDCSAVSDAGLGLLSLVQPLEYLCLRRLAAVGPASLYRFIYRNDLSHLEELHLPGCSALNDQALNLLARRCSSLPKLVADDCPRVSRRFYESLWGPNAVGAGSILCGRSSLISNGPSIPTIQV